MTRRIKVFVAGIIQGSRVDDGIFPQDYRKRLVPLLRDCIPGASIYDPVSLYPASVSFPDEKGRKVFMRLMRKAGECDVLIAFLPEASLGTGIELYQANRAGALVLTVSPMRHNWAVKYLSSRMFEDVDGLEEYLRSEEFKRWLKRRKST